MRVVRWFIALVILAGICWWFPLFHVATMKTATAEKAAVTFNATVFAETYWTNQLLASFAKTVKADLLLPAIQADSGAAKIKFARSLGLSASYFYFVSGSGHVVAVSDDEVSLAIMPASTNTEVSLQTGLVFGNALRDGTGLLNTSDYPNSQDFNDISAALNHLVEARVLPKLREQAKVGANMSFVGCAEVDDETTDLKPLKVIPIQTEVQ